MKIKILFISTLLTAVGVAGCTTTSSVDETDVGIGMDGVFSDPSPSTFDYPTEEAGKSDRIEKSYYTAPPLVPHTVAEYLPITMEDNECLECHDKPKIQGRDYVKGEKLAMPASHYGGFGGTGDEDEVSGAVYTCTLCHAPASNAQPLVENTF